MSEPRWVGLATLHRLHDRQIELFGGLHGVRGAGAIESALMRPINAWHYATSLDVEALAATYLYALVRQQGFLDGNKRTALAAALVFLRLNGRTLVAPPAELYALVVSAATDDVQIEQVGAWIREHVEAYPPR